MAKPELPALRQPRPSSALLAQKWLLMVAICEGEETCELGPEQIHLGRLRWFDVQCGCCNRGCGAHGFGRFCVLVEKFFELLKVRLEGVE